jgi:hypothetical protein
LAQWALAELMRSTLCSASGYLTSFACTLLMIGQKFGHQDQTRSLEEDKLGFRRPSLSTTRLHGQVYQ